MDQDGFVAGLNLHFNDLINNISHSLDVCAASIRSPVGDVELTHMMYPMILRECLMKKSIVEMYILSCG